MNSLEKRLENLESTVGEKARSYAIVPVDFTGTLPPNVMGICTGVPRHGDEPGQFTMIRSSK